jgi:hypothetical protein
MTEKLTALEVNAQTGETIERPLTTEEIKERNQVAAQDAKLVTDLQAKGAARQSALAKLAALGLTEDEAKAIAG